MDFLVISYNYNKEASGNMSKRIVKALAQGGHNVYLITASDVDDESCKVHVCKPLIPTNSFIYRLIRTIYKAIFKDLDEYHPIWRRKAVRMGLKISQENHIDYIYARSSPVEANKVGYQISKQTGISVIQHFADPYPTRFATKYAFVRKWQARIIRKVIQNAKLISYGNEVMLEQSLKEVGLAKDARFFVSPDPGDNKGFHILPKPIHDKLVLVYLGGVGGQRDPNPLYSAVDKLNREGIKVELRLYTEKPTKMINVPDSIIFMGRQDDINKVLSEADICIELGIKWPDSPYISSKLKDYLSVNRPIIAITTGKCATSAFLADYKTVKIVDNEPALIQKTISEFSTEKHNDSDYSERKHVINSFSSSVVAGSFMDYINS